MEKELINFSENIEKALKERKPIVGLETTIISHGMPYPENVKTALEIEKIGEESEIRNSWSWILGKNYY